MMTMGIDEVGRGPLAGPVTACGVVLGDWRPAAPLVLADSKRLSKPRREALADLIRANALAVGLGWASAEEIDRLNILQATFLAMQRAVKQAIEMLVAKTGLSEDQVRLVVDGSLNPVRHGQGLDWPWQTQTCVGGDSLVAEVSAASIVAKVQRDAHMRALDQQYPGYGMGQHAGYGTAQHLRALKALGPSPVHRFSFGPVRQSASPAGGPA
ncbi:MAG: ribonuclease [Pseudomonadota bacterium]|jgi:ribonuclease HII